MDILKARQRQKEAKEARERERAQGQHASPAAGTTPPTAAQTGLPAPAQTTLPSPSTTAVEQRPSIPMDPLQEFLAVYDEGTAFVSDASGEGMAIEEEKRFLSFDLAGEAYAADIMDVREILKVVALTEVPRAPKEVLGVLSKRGVVMPVVDLAAVVGLRQPDRRLHRDQRVLVGGEGDRVCGLRVDRVRQVVRLPRRAIEDVPPSLGSKNAHMLLGLGRTRGDQAQASQMLILLDINAVLAHFSETMGIVPEAERSRG